MNLQHTEFDLAWAKKAGREKFLKAHSHIKGAAEWFDTEVGEPKEKEPKEKAK